MRRQGLVLTIDVGSSNCKVTLFDASGATLGRELVAHRSLSCGTLGVEQDPGEWWEHIVSIVQKLGQRFPEEMKDLYAISVTGQMHGVVCVGRDLQPIGNCLTLRDRRGELESQEIANIVGEREVYRITGGRLDASSPAAKIRWIMRNQPERYKASMAFLSPKDYIRMRLTGRIATDPTDAAGSLLMDVASRTWSEVLIQAVGLERSKLPDILPSTEVAGYLTCEAAQALGLREGVPVVVGGGDDIEFLGTGLVSYGIALEHIGTTGSIVACVDRPYLDPEMRVEVYPHVDPNFWLVGGSTTNAGAALRWATNVFGVGLPIGGTTEPDVLPQASPDDDHVRLIRPLVFLPYLAGERCPIWEPQSKGVLFGLTLDHSRQDILRAVLEGVACSLSGIMRTMLEMGIRIDTIISADNGQMNEDWAQLRANLYRRTLAFSNVVDATALGALLLAAVGLGIYPDLRHGVESTVKIERTVAPNEVMTAFYEDVYRQYDKVSKHVLPLFRELASEQARCSTRGRELGKGNTCAR